MLRPFLAVAMLAAAPVAAAQDGETHYMGIDLTVDPEPVAAQQRSVEEQLRPLLDEGVELGCLAFEPPATFSQTDDTSDACREYIVRLAEETAPHAEAEGTGDTDAEAKANTLRQVPLVTLARVAQGGDKRAQLELGMRFEEGRGGVGVDLPRALELYTMAGRATPARRGMVVRETEGGEGGGVSRGERSPRIPGLPEARERRDALEARMESGD